MLNDLHIFPFQRKIVVPLTTYRNIKENNALSIASMHVFYHRNMQRRETVDDNFATLFAFVVLRIT